MEKDICVYCGQNHYDEETDPTYDTFFLYEKKNFELARKYANLIGQCPYHSFFDEEGRDDTGHCISKRGEKGKRKTKLLIVFPDSIFVIYNFDGKNVKSFYSEKWPEEKTNTA